jgi:hypothetical protein
MARVNSRIARWSFVNEYKLQKQDLPRDSGMRISQRSSAFSRLRRNQLDLWDPATISTLRWRGIDLDQSNKTRAKQHPKQGPARKEAKPAKAKEEARKPMDPERLNRAIQYLRNERQR